MEKFKIFLTHGVAEGGTEMAAYCNALQMAGIASLNLITLSSVLPHDSEVIFQKPKIGHNDYGKMMYVIFSEKRTAKVGETICAGIGWIYEKDGTGHGMVVEIQGNNEDDLRREIEMSLDNYRLVGDKKYEDENHIIIESAICENRPVSVLVSLCFSGLKDWK